MNKRIFTQALLFVLSCSTFIFVGCKDNKDGVDGQPQHVVYGSDVIENAQPLEVVEEYENDALNTAMYLFGYKNDSLFITRNIENQEIGFVTIYDKDFNEIRSFFKYGNGANEVLSPDVLLYNDRVLVNDHGKGQMAWVDIDSVVNDSNYKPELYPYSDKHVFVGTLCADKSFILCDNFFFKDEALGIDQGTSRLIRTDGKTSLIESAKHGYFTLDVTGQGYIVANKDESRFMYADKDKSLIEFYDADLNLEKVIEGPVVFPIEYKLRPMPMTDVPLVAYKNGHPMAYRGCCIDDDYIYLNYIGDYSETKDEGKELTSYILKIDWDGNVIKTYSFPHELWHISKAANENAFYATQITLDFEMKFLKLDIKE